MSSDCLDGNEAAARVAYALSEAVAIYPITPASPMGEHADAWAAAGQQNLWGAVPDIVEMQSEGGAAGTLHGALQTGALATTFTASQGLLLMLPNMFKIAGELTPAVIHVAARSIATHALSIFGDHSDVMAARTTGLRDALRQLGPGGARLRGRVARRDPAHPRPVPPLLRRLPDLPRDQPHRAARRRHAAAPWSSEEDVVAHKLRRLRPTAPSIRGTAQNPDVFFQAREAANPFHDAVPDAVADAFDRLAELTGRRYGLVDYEGAPDAERVIVVMGSGRVRSARRSTSWSPTASGSVWQRSDCSVRSRSTRCWLRSPTRSVRSPCSTGRRSRARSASRSSRTS